MSLLSFFTTDQIEAAINDCFYSDPKYDELFAAQQRATNVDERKKDIAEMQQLFYDAAAYHILYYDSELHAMRTDKFTGWVNQPPDTGTPLFGFGYSGYMALTDASAQPTAAPTTAATAAPSGGATPAPTAAPSDNANAVSTPVLIGGAIVLIVLVGVLLVMRRRGGAATAKEEE
jgi:peptide/nickel transport system substrate-binding protein